MAKKPEHFWIEPNKLSEKGIDFCTLAAQGLWLKMMRLLHASERYGYLSRDGKSVPDEQIARRCGIDHQEWIVLMAELFDFDLLRRSNDRIIFSPELVTQAEWRIKNAKRQKNFQDNKRKKKVSQNGENSNSQYNGEYNGYITPEVTDNYHDNFKPLNTLSSNEEKSGGKPPTAADSSKLDIQGGETGKDYLERKQQEFPNKPVLEIYRRFVSLCGSEKYQNLRNTRRAFDKWLENEDETLDIPLEGEKFVVLGIGELK